jgi:uncharacterized protein (TIGR00369 family)
MEPFDEIASPAAFAGTLMERLGIEVCDVTPESCRGSMPVAGNTQPSGLLHGGASAALAETLGSVCATAHAGPGRTVVGIELNVTHHRAARSGSVHGVANALHLGGKLASYEISIRDDEGQLVCSGRLTCIIMKKDA